MFKTYFLFDLSKIFFLKDMFTTMGEMMKAFEVNIEVNSGLFINENIIGLFIRIKI